jgi:hypothetical protein
MNKLVVRAGVTLVGMASVLAWWTVTGKQGSNHTGSSRKMPEKIFGGGGQRVTIDVDVNGPAELGFMGTLPRKPNGDQALVEDSEPVSPGAHSWTIELAPHTSGTFDLRALNPQVGNRLSWTITVDGKEFARETDTLEKPLQAREAQGLQVRIERDE